MSANQSNTNPGASNSASDNLQQFQRADEIINLGKLAYEANQQKNAMLLAQVRQDAAQKFANDTPKIIKEVSDQYRSYLSRNGQHPDEIKAVGDSRISIYRNPIVNQKNKFLGDFTFHDMYEIYSSESQKACANTGEMLKQLGFKIISANTRKYDYTDATDREDPKHHHGYIFQFAAEELNKKK